MDRMKELRELMESDEELLPELAECVVDTPKLGEFICHPLVHTWRMGPDALFNLQYRQKVEALAKARAMCKWHTVVFLHERPYRVEAFMEIAYLLDDEEWWELFGSVWTDSENMHQHIEEWRNLMDNAPPGDPMDDDERQVYEGLPDSITVYRGTAADDGMGSGFSWTLERERAEWFAHRFAEIREGEAQVYTGTVKKVDVVAYFAGRGEAEIVSQNVEIEKVEVVA